VQTTVISQTSLQHADPKQHMIKCTLPQFCWLGSFYPMTIKWSFHPAVSIIAPHNNDC